MKFIKQIKMEIKSIIRSKFLLIIGIIILAFSIISPLLSLTRRSQDGGYYPMSVAYESVSYSSKMGYYDDYYSGEEPITVDGVTVEADNPFYWNIKSIMEQNDYMEGMEFSHAQTKDMVIDMMDIELEYYLRFARYIKTYEDYRSDIAWSGQSTLFDKFIHERIATADLDALKEALGFRYGYNEETFDDMYVNLTAQQRFEAIDKAEDILTRLYTVVENNDFPQYITLRIEQSQKEIADNESMIDILVKQITENPSQEDMLSDQIKMHQDQIAYIENATIPMLEYRLEKNIIPRDGSWQNSAISDIENAESNLQWTKIQSEEDFNKDQYLKMQYRTYARYTEAIQAQIDGYNNTKLIAKNSIDADKPDMKYVPDEARSQTTGFLSFSTFVALFGVLIGGWIIASEFQLGTVRLLMIRPRTRTKILMAKFAAGLLVCLAIYVAGSFINLLMNGILFGFSDYAFPNFTVTGEVGFLVYYLPKLLACMLPIAFGYCVAFMFSTVVKNIAVSIAVPIVCFIGCVIATALVLAMSWGGGGGWEWIAYTPVPYVMLSDFFVQNSAINLIQQNGMMFYPGYGMGMLAALSAACTAVSVLVFRKQDITH